jgi:hypothetical protein
LHELLPLKEALDKNLPGQILLEGLNIRDGEGALHRQSSIGISGERFVSDESSAALRLNLRGWTLLPGLCDAHLHLFHEADRNCSVDLSGLSSRDELWKRLEEAEGDAPLLGMSWDESEWEDSRFPRREELDRRFPGREIALVRICGHAAVGSTAALQRCSLLDSESASGLLLERDAYAIRRVFAAGEERLLHEAGKLGAEMASEGITHLTEMGASRLHERVGSLPDDFPLEIDYYLPVSAGKELPEATHAPLPHRFLGYKFFLDGSLGARSAALRSEYREGGRGQLLWERDALRKRCDEIFRRGQGVSFHAIGDRAIDQALDILEDLSAPQASARIEHLEMANPKQMERIARLGVGACLQPNFMDRWGRPGGLYEQRFGKDFQSLFPAPGAFRKRGLQPAYGTDGMPRDLWAAMRAAVDPSLFGEEADHPAQALSAVSFDAARLVSADGERGSVRPGKSADFFLVAEDPLLQDFARSLSSAMTVRAGQVTHFHEGSS